MARLTNRREKGLIICLLAVALAIACYDIVFLGKTFKVTNVSGQSLSYGVYGQRHNKPFFLPTRGIDTAVLEEPLYHFIRTNIRHGIVPLWNPHQALGYSFISMLQVGMFFPLNILQCLLPEMYAWDIVMLLRFLLAGFFTYCLMRQLRFSAIPSFVAALTFMLSGPFFYLQEWSGNVDMLAPLLLCVLERLAQEPNKKTMSMVACVVALTIFAGHAEHVLLVNTYGLAFFCVRLLMMQQKQLTRTRLIYGMNAYALGIGLSAVVLLPFMRNFIFESWHGHPLTVGVISEENPVRIITLALPYFFQSMPISKQWVPAGWWGGHIGIVPFLLACVGLFNRHRRGLNYFFFGMAAFLIAKAYGFVLVNWIGHIPPFRLVRFSIHTPHLIALSVAVCAGMGARTILHSKKTFYKAAVGSGFFLALIGMYLFAFRNASHSRLAISASIFAVSLLCVFQLVLFLWDKKYIRFACVTVLLVAILMTELFCHVYRGRSDRFASFPKVPYIEFLKNMPDRARSYGNIWTFFPNTGTGYGIDDLGVFIGLLPKRYVEFVNDCVVKNRFVNDLRPPALRSMPLSRSKEFLDLLNVR